MADKDLCLKCNLDHCKCRKCIFIDVLCARTVDTCPCWTLEKCIKVCQNKDHSPFKVDDCRPINEEDCECGNEDDGDVEVGKLEGTDPSRHTKCCKEVKVCVFQGDKISADYIITATKFGERKLFSINVKLCNTCKNCVDVIKIVTVIEKRNDGGKWKPVDDVDARREECNFGVVEPDQCVTALLVGGVEALNIHKGDEFRVTIKVVTDKGTSVEHVPLPDFGCRQCVVKKWKVFEDDEEEPIATIKESEKICVCNQTYGPFFDDHEDDDNDKDHGEHKCGKDITNFAKLCPIKKKHHKKRDDDDDDDEESSECGELKGDCTVSNTTKLTPLCQKLSVSVSGNINCVPSQQWCLCKTSDPLCCTKHDDPRERSFFGHYTLDATQQSASNTCTLNWQFSASVPCLSYPKKFTYKLYYGPVSNGVLLSSGNFTLSPTTTSFSTSGSQIVVDPQPGTALTLVIDYTSDLYNLSRCHVEPCYPGVPRCEKSKTFTSPAVPISTCDLTVSLSDSFIHPVDFSVVDQSIADQYPDCCVIGPSTGCLAPPTKNGEPVSVQEIQQLFNGGVELDTALSPLVYDFFLLFTGVPTPTKVVNEAKLVVTRTCDDHEPEQLNCVIDKTSISNPCLGAQKMAKAVKVDAKKSPKVDDKKDPKAPKSDGKKTPKADDKKSPTEGHRRWADKI